MRDYEELVKRLRKLADAQFFDFEKSPYLQAADAIEELKHQVFLADLACKAEAAKVPRWIPVTERLPEKMQYVLVRYQNNDMAVASWFGGDEHIRFWRAMADEGWCADCDTEPTHWMPLPEPPEEET